MSGQYALTDEEQKIILKMLDKHNIQTCPTMRDYNEETKQYAITMK